MRTPIRVNRIHGQPFKKVSVARDLGDFDQTTINHAWCRIRSILSKITHGGEKMRALAVLGGAVLVVLSVASIAQTNLQTDRFGNTTGTMNGQSVNIQRDQFGNTTGRIGNNSVNTQSDQFGNTTGRIGDRSVNTQTDSFGNTTGRIGNSSVNTQRDSFGNTTGTIGNSTINRHTDQFGNTTGR